MNRNPICQAKLTTGERRGERCRLPGFRPHHGRWFCIIHHEAAVRRAKRFQDQLYGINSEEKNRDDKPD